MIGRFFDFFSTHWQGLLVFGLLLVAIALLLQWLAWIFSWGRFQRRDGPAVRQSLRFVLADLVVKIIDDFRHLLALIIVVIFALALLYSLALVAWEANGRIEATAKALQAVASSLGGLIGAILGYYFGEKAGEKAAAAQARPQPAAQTPAQPTAPAGPAAGAAPSAVPSAGPPVPPIQPAPAPPGNR